MDHRAHDLLPQLPDLRAEHPTPPMPVTLPNPLSGLPFRSPWFSTRAGHPPPPLVPRCATRRRPMPRRADPGAPRPPVRHTRPAPLPPTLFRPRDPRHPAERHHVPGSPVAPPARSPAIRNPVALHPRRADFRVAPFTRRPAPAADLTWATRTRRPASPAAPTGRHLLERPVFSLRSANPSRLPRTAPPSRRPVDPAPHPPVRRLHPRRPAVPGRSAVPPMDAAPGLSPGPRLPSQSQPALGFTDPAHFPRTFLPARGQLALAIPYGILWKVLAALRARGDSRRGQTDRRHRFHVRAGSAQG